MWTKRAPSPNLGALNTEAGVLFINIYFFMQTRKNTLSRNVDNLKHRPHVQWTLSNLFTKKSSHSLTGLPTSTAYNMSKMPTIYDQYIYTMSIILCQNREECNSANHLLTGEACHWIVPESNFSTKSRPPYAFDTCSAKVPSVWGLNILA